jgi:hypothetical protein
LSGKESCSEIFDDFPNVFFTYSFWHKHFGVFTCFPNVCFQAWLGLVSSNAHYMAARNLSFIQDVHCCGPTGVIRGSTIYHTLPHTSCNLLL